MAVYLNSPYLHGQANATHFFSQLRQIDRSQLGQAKQVSYDILEDTLMTVIEGYKWKE